MKRVISFLLCMLLTFLCACNSQVNSDQITAAQKLNNEPELTQQQADRLVDLMAKLESYRGGGAVQKQVKAELEKVEWVEKVEETEDGGLTCYTDFGVTAVWTPDPKKEKLEDLKQIKLETTLSSSEVAVKQIAILCPYASTEPDFNADDYTALGKDLGGSISCNVTVFKDEEVSLDLMKNLGKYDMVWIRTLGGINCLFDSTLALIGKEPYIMIGEKVATAEDCIKHSGDFLRGRIVLNLRDGRLGVSGKFFEHHYGADALAGTFFHIAANFSMKTNGIADALISRGAAWVEGWNGNVNFDNDYVQLAMVISSLLKGKSVYQAVKDADQAAKNGYSFYQSDCTLEGKGKASYDIKTVVIEQPTEKVTAAVTTQLATEGVTEITQAVTEAVTEALTEPNATVAEKTTQKRPEPATQQKPETTTRKKPTTTKAPTTKSPTTKVPTTKIPDNNNSVTVGKYITFGSYEQDNNLANGKEPIEWLVLAKQGDKVLVISKYAIDRQVYSETWTGMTWKNCALRSWLNNKYLNTAFTSSERSRIQTTVTDPDGSTKDKVFLLSVDEALKYFGSENILLKCKATEYAVEQGLWIDSDGVCGWWLRLPESNPGRVGCVDNGGTIGEGIGTLIDDFNNDGVRPAMWITL